MTIVTIYGELRPEDKIEYIESIVGHCPLCDSDIKVLVPKKLTFSIDNKPLFCEECRKAILKLIGREKV